jgi:hypothetical protein
MQTVVRMLTSGGPEIEDCVEVFRHTLVNFYTKGTPDEQQLVYLLVRTDSGESLTKEALAALKDQFGTQDQVEIECVLRVARATFWDQGTHLEIVSPYVSS